MKLVVAPETEKFIERFRSRPPQAVLLAGPEGIGLYTLARHLATSTGQLLDVIQPIAKTKTSIPVISTETVRGLYERARSRQKDAAFIIIDDADSMTLPAQNALLKLLEEPNQSIHFVLTSHQPERLLPTIRSRLQQFTVPRVDELASQRLAKALGLTEPKLLAQALYVASGLPAEMSRLASDATYFKDLAERASLARRFIEGTAYERLVLLQGFREDRAGALAFIQTVLLILERLFVRTPSQDTAKLIEKLLESTEAIQANGNIRTQLSAAVL